MGKALRGAKTRRMTGQASGRVVKSTDRGSKPSSSAAGKKYSSTTLGKMC